MGATRLERCAMSGVAVAELSAGLSIESYLKNTKGWLKGEINGVPTSFAQSTAAKNVMTRRMMERLQLSVKSDGVLHDVEVMLNGGYKTKTDFEVVPSYDNIRHEVLLGIEFYDNVGTFSFSDGFKKLTLSGIPTTM